MTESPQAPPTESLCGSVLVYPTREEWLAARKNFITSSDVAPILGLDAYRSPLAVYSEKRGLTEPMADNPMLQRGRRIEPYILDWYQEETGYDVERAGFTLWVHPKYDWLATSRDATSTTPFGDKRNVEAKSARFAKRGSSPLEETHWGDAGTDQIPAKYLCQTQIQMSCAGFEVTDVPVIFTMDDFRIYEVAANGRFVANALELLEEFKQMLDRGEPPAVDPLRDGGLVTELWKRVEPIAMNLSKDQWEKAQNLGRVRAAKSKLEKEEKLLKTELLGVLKDCEVGRYQGVPALLRKQIKKNFQAKAAFQRTEIHLRVEGESENE